MSNEPVQTVPTASEQKCISPHQLDISSDPVTENSTKTAEPARAQRPSNNLTSDITTQNSVKHPTDNAKKSVAFQDTDKPISSPSKSDQQKYESVQSPRLSASKQITRKDSMKGSASGTSSRQSNAHRSDNTHVNNEGLNDHHHQQTGSMPKSQSQQEPPTTSGGVAFQKAKKGHLKIDSEGQITYKNTSSNALISAIQLGIAYSVGKLTANPDRDILMQDFFQVDQVKFPCSGTSVTPSHKFNDFVLTDYSPIAFRYFRDIFNISPQDFMASLSINPLRQLSNPGASGSLFFVSKDDIFIIKTVDKREASFLQQLLPGYYMNVHQNPKTFLPKFFGLYSYKSGGANIRLCVMNNLMPSKMVFHEKYDIKGSTFKRKASGKERAKSLPTFKDLDFIDNHPLGLTLKSETHKNLFTILEKDVRVLEGFKIMDYSLLLLIHNKTQHDKRKCETMRRKLANYTTSVNNIHHLNSNESGNEQQQQKNAHTFNANNTQQKDCAVLETITENDINKLDLKGLSQLISTLSLVNDDPEFASQMNEDMTHLLKYGFPAKNQAGDDLILFIGLIDILQNYRFIKRTEHNLKALFQDKDGISVHNPVFYASRFLSFCRYAFQDEARGATRLKPPEPKTLKKKRKYKTTVNNKNYSFGKT